MGTFATPFGGGLLNVALANYAKAYRNNKLIGDMLSPRVPVDRQSFQYVIHDRASMRLPASTLRAPGNRPATVRTAFSTDNYNCKSHALSTEVPFELEQYGQGFGFSQQAKASKTVLDLLLLDREVALAALVAGAGTTLPLSGTTMWDNAASTPIEDITAARATVRQSGVEANVLILGDPVVDVLLNNPEIIDRLKFTNTTGWVDEQKLSAVLNIKVVRASAVQVDKNDVPSFVWGQTATLAYVQDVTSQEDISSVKTFTWTAAQDTEGGYGVIVEPKYPLSSKAVLTSADWYYDQKITAPETLYTFTNCCAAPTYVTLPSFAAGY